MTEDRKTSVAPSRPDHAARLRLDPCKRRVPALLCLLISVFCLLSSAFGEGIAMHKAEAHFSDDSYQLSADFDISFNFVVEQALTRGVSLYFVNEFTLTRPRWYWMDEVVAQSEQTIKLSYNSLTRQYRITRGSLFQNFASMDEALNSIKHQSASIQAELLKKKDVSYIASARMHLDVTQLPKPLQVNALAGDDWSLDSDWYRWIVRPDAAAH
ncbi:MAG: hypothetical protein B7Z62_07370 [Deltaproteobacteria bacterium 37-65-8]|nr:MAG: hypothetical protein B7Z62_07370 [Deltaproteobacteria bacterium 37-65-8]